VQLRTPVSEQALLERLNRQLAKRKERIVPSQRRLERLREGRACAIGRGYDIVSDPDETFQRHEPNVDLEELALDYDLLARDEFLEGLDLSDIIGIYDVERKPWGSYDVKGPNGHRWVCPNGETRRRAIETVKAFERAYVEGIKSITGDADIMTILTALSLLGEDTADTESERMKSLKPRAQQLLRKIERLTCAKPKDDCEELNG